MAENHISLEMEMENGILKNFTEAAKLRSKGNGNGNGNGIGQINEDTQDEVEILTPNGRVPKAVPEPTDDEDEDDYDDRPLSTDTRSGVDDGLLPPTDENDSHIPRPIVPRSKRPSFAFPTYDGPAMVDINGVPTPLPDVNAYQHKKTLAQGMMDLALLSANANQLRYVLESYKRHPYYYPSLVFISISIIFQIAVGVGLILNSRYNIKDEKDICRANKINNYTVIGIFIVTVVNVFISAFGVADPSGEN